ncbi:glycosyltransferase [Clostridium sp. HBUAS56010]|uniref:glycosyltransferase n=1 Tax=Clostridium sp. HBUAS56010 TaxID=2571127 RepID=UPI00117834D1|nr:glycosyltransferase [Clostridium sp. HBUAS56010]
MNISNKILSITMKWKPILLKIFPYDFLKRIKGNMIKKSFQKISRINIEPFDRKKFKDGINLIGNIRAETGLGQSCRLVADELEASGIPYSIYQYDQLGTMSEGNYQQYESKISSELPYNINLIHINPHELGLAFQQAHNKIWNGRYNIGFWLWELEDFPDEWVPCFHCMDEIWTPSKFISDCIQKKTDLKVVTIPYHVSLTIPEKGKNDYRKRFGLPTDKFLYLMMYDRTSMTERKNPKAVIEAFKMAFSKEEDVGLVIKINNPSEKEIDLISSMLPEHKNVYFIIEILERQQVNELIYCVDVVVSLHRAEGFGLVLAEAMLLGKPTIATNWSSNTEFMTKETACMVDAELITLNKDFGSFKKGNRWAEPNEKQGADYMRRLYDDSEFYHILSDKAKDYIEKKLSMSNAVKIINKRISSIYKEQ